jgi:phosphatidylserine synthase
LHNFYIRVLRASYRTRTKDELRSSGLRLRNRLPERTERTERIPLFDDDNVLFQLTVADYVSIVALFFAWCSVSLFLIDEPNWAVIVMFGAFFFDKLDGYVARRWCVTSPFGRQVDSYIDIFTYLVPAALLFHYTLAPNFVVSVVIGFLIIGFGGLRLIRHNDEGFGSTDGVSYYRGTIVVHTNFVVVTNYLLASFVAFWNGWFAAATVVVACPLMVSDYRSYKTVRIHWVVAVLSVVVVGLCLILEYGS